MDHVERPEDGKLNGGKTSLRTAGRRSVLVCQRVEAAFDLRFHQLQIIAEPKSVDLMGHIDVLWLSLRCMRGDMEVSRNLKH